jgi:hypothetical protein
MASRKHHKQDSTRPTKARSRRMKGVSLAELDELETETEKALGPAQGTH